MNTYKLGKPILFFLLIIIILGPALPAWAANTTVTTSQTQLYGFNQDWLKATVVVIYGDQYGTGWWVNPTTVVTAAHVVGYKSSVAVTIVRGTTHLSGTVLVADKELDVAAIKVDNADKISKTVLYLARQLPSYGSTIYTIGYPSELLEVVGSVEQMSDNPRVLESSLTWIDNSRGLVELGGITDAGNSGGPVLDGNGNVIGLVSFALTGKAGTLYFATDVNNIKTVLSQAGVSYELGSNGLLPQPENPAVAGAIAGAAAGALEDIFIILIGVFLGAAILAHRKR